MKNSLKNCTVFIFNMFMIIVSIGVIEIASYGYLKFKNRPSVTSMDEFLRANPQPFYGTDDYKDKNISFKNVCSGKVVFDEKIKFPFFQDPNLACGLETVTNGLRKTTDQPKEFKKRILMFGGSTMWGSYSADSNTIPSQLQRLINKKRADILVLNYGFATVTAAQQLSRLKSLSIKESDIVVFYDGGNDIWQGLVYGNPEGTVIGYNQENRIKIKVTDIKYYLSRHSNFYNVLAQIKTALMIKNGSCEKFSFKPDQALLQRAFEIYKQKLIEAKTVAEKGSSKFFHFFQPSLFTQKRHSVFENKLIATMPSEMIPCGTANGPFEFGSKYFKDNYRNIKSVINGSDLSEALDPFDNQREFFVDYIHVSSAANRIIAEELFKRLDSEL